MLTMSETEFLFHKYRGAMAYIEVKLPNGDISIGSSFHIGEGVFITARHVVENNKILSMSTSEIYYQDDKNGEFEFPDPHSNLTLMGPKPINVIARPYYHPNKSIDIAVLVTDRKDFPVIYLQMDGHLVPDGEYTLMNTLIMGYPPIPFSDRPTLIVATAEVNAIFYKYGLKEPFVIISAMPRGGFSGGVCLSEYDYALGLIVESLVTDHKATELGFMCVIPVGPIYECLYHHNIIPKYQQEEWREQFEDNSQNEL